MLFKRLGYCVEYCGQSMLNSLKEVALAAVLKRAESFPDMRQNINNHFPILPTEIQALILINLWHKAHHSQLLKCLPLCMESLFSTEYFKALPLHTMNVELDEMGNGWIYEGFKNRIMRKLQKHRNVDSFMKYVIVPVNFSLSLVDGGFYNQALIILEQLTTNLIHYANDDSTSDEWQISLNEIHTVVATAKLHCYNSLYEVKKAQDIYNVRNNILAPLLEEEFQNFNEKAAAFHTQCSRYCYIIGDMSSSHKHIADALQHIKEMANPHPRIVIDVLRQATYTYIELGHPDKAKASILTALTWCKHFVDKAVTDCSECHHMSHSILFLDCLVDLAFYLERTDQLQKCVIVLEEAFRGLRNELGYQNIKVGIILLNWTRARFRYRYIDHHSSILWVGSYESFINDIEEATAKMRRGGLPENHIWHAIALFTKAEIKNSYAFAFKFDYNKNRQWNDVESIYEEILPKFIEHFGKDNYYVAKILVNWGSLIRQTRGKYCKADVQRSEKRLSEGVAILKSIFIRPNHQDILAGQLQIARNACYAKKYRAAEELTIKCEEEARANFGPAHALLKHAYKNLTVIYTEMLKMGAEEGISGSSPIIQAELKLNLYSNKFNTWSVIREAKQTQDQLDYEENWEHAWPQIMELGPTLERPFQGPEPNLIDCHAYLRDQINECLL